MKANVGSPVRSAQIIREREIYHGIVLDKIVNKKGFRHLRPFRTAGTDAAADYVVNDTSTLHLKHSTRPSERKLSDGLFWTFTFAPEHGRRISELMQNGDVNIVLVCGDKTVATIKDWNVCMLFKDDVSKLLDLTTVDSHQAITVRYMPGTGTWLRVRGSLKADWEKIPRGRLDQWELPA